MRYYIRHGSYILAFLISSISAATINVPADYSTIQAALTAADSSDTVLVQPGTYYENIFWPDINGIKLISAGNSSNTVIDGGGISSVIYMNPASATIDTTTVVRGFEITNGGNIVNGGGIYINSCDPKIASCVINNNTATDMGGGIYISGGDAILVNLIISKNTAYHAGGIYISGDSQIRNVIITDCVANYRGGGIGIWPGSPIITNSIIKNNTASDGGALFSVGSPSISETQIIDNCSSDDAGGISTSDGTFSGIIVTGNSAAKNGGGIKLGGNAIISNSIIANNTAGTAGGGMYYSGGGSKILTNTSIVGNVSDIGSAIHVSAGTSGDGLNAKHLTIYNNSGEFGAIYINDYYGYAGIDSIIFSNISFNNEGIYNIDNSGSVPAINNYWGHSSGPYHPSQNPTGLGDSVNAFVNVTPWLTTPDITAPPIPIQNFITTSTGNDFINFTWDPSPLGDFAGFKLYYDSDSSGYPYSNSIDVGTDTSYSLIGLSFSTTYYLAVTCYDTDGNESWYSNEVVATTRVLKAQNLDMGNDEDIQHLTNHTPSIRWDYYDSMAELQTHYHVQVSSHQDFATIDLWDSGEIASDADSIVYAGNALSDGDTYYLRVKVSAGGFWSDWSSLEFRMNSAPTPPTALHPINNEVVTAIPALSIANSTDPEGDTLTYSFRVYGDASLSTLLDSAIAVLEGQDTTSWQVATALPDNGQYWWITSANDGYEEGAASDTVSFLLNAVGDAPNAFALLSPQDSAEVAMLTPLLDWEVASDPDPVDTVRYSLYLDTPDPGVEVISTDTATSYQVVSPLIDNTTYYWKVVAVDLAGASTENTGGYHSFVVWVLGLDELAGIPEEFALHQNYPNPFNPTSTIQYDLPEATAVTILVYDILGREITRLVDRQMEPGYHQVIWDGKDSRGQSVPTGIYIARLVTPQYTKSIKMLLLK